MTKFFAAAALALVAAPAFANDASIPAAAPMTAVVATPGKMLVDAAGARLAPVYRVDATGAAQIIFEGRVVAIPASTLSMNNGRLTTSLKKTDVLAQR